MTKLRTALLAALATMPLLAGGASAHGWWGGPGYDPYWRERAERHEYREAERAREWAWRRPEAWVQPRYYAPTPYGYHGGWGPRW